jgi:polyphosphate kinase
LDFNGRVLANAEDPSIPVLERLKFLCISSTNLDEFFEVRVAGLKQKAMAGLSSAEPDNLSPHEVLKRISDKAHALVASQYRVLNTLLRDALKAEGVHLLTRATMSEAQKKWAQGFFRTELLPILSPVGLDPSHPFPRILNKSLNFIVSLQGKDAFGRDVDVAIVPAPRALPRLIRVPESIADYPFEFVSLATIIRDNVEELFPDMTLLGSYQFRVTRNSNLFFDEEEIDDLLITLEGELPSRRYGDAVRLEIEEACPEELAGFLLNHFGLAQEDIYRVDGPVNLNRLLAIFDLVEKPELKFAPFVSGLPRSLVPGADVFEAIRKSDILLHHPFESFVPVVDFLRQASRDPQVLVIKQTLYRMGPDSPLVDYLIDAAHAGKEVTAVVELRARFDEEANINVATRLQEAGAHVVYGVVGFKTHGKMLMVVRREGDRLRRYVHLGTGNYHARTAKIYTDYGLLTSDPVIGEDIHKLFMQLTGLGRVTQLGKCLQSPFTLQKTFQEKIQREIEHAKAGKEGKIIAKMNALTDPQMIQVLYEASQAGVKVQLIIRGICCLLPGVSGLSENISVRSIVGRFLEHTRVYYFHNEGRSEVFLASADLMTRNLSQRVELAFPIESPTLKARIIREAITLYLEDNSQSWCLGVDGTYSRLVPGENEPALSAQMTLLNELAQDRRE